MNEAHESLSSYMVKKAACNSNSSGLFQGYLERQDTENHNNMIKTGVHQQAIELFEAAKIWWKHSCVSSERNSSHSVDIPAWFALAADSKTQVWVEGIWLSIPDAL